MTSLMIVMVIGALLAAILWIFAAACLVIARRRINDKPGAVRRWGNETRVPPYIAARVALWETLLFGIGAVVLTALTVWSTF